LTKSNALGQEKVLPLLVKFSVPAIVGMIVNSLYNIVDRIFIGNSSDLGSYGLAGITIAFPLMNILMAIGILFGIGGATLFSLRLGEKRPDKAEEALGNSFTLLVGTGILFMILGQIYLEPLLILFGASESILPYSMEYMRVIFSGAVFQIVSMGMNHFIRADGSPKIAMLTMFLGAGTNIVLDPIFIYGFNMGMTGAALATILAQLLSSIWVLSYFLGKRSKMKLKKKYLRLNFKVAATITTLGIPGSLLQLANSILNIALNKNLLIYGGDFAVSAMGVIYSIQTIFLMPVIGVRQGVQPIISFNFGAKKYERVKEATKLAVLGATGFVTLGFILTHLFPEFLISLFNREPELISIGSAGLKAWFLCMPVVGFQIIGSTLFQASGKSGIATFLTLTRQLILLIPAVIIFPKFWGVKGIYYAAPFADFFSAALTGLFFYYGMKNLGQQSPHQDAKDILTSIK
jgi:putative MATE family efflux protein